MRRMMPRLRRQGLDTETRHRDIEDVQKMPQDRDVQDQDYNPGKHLVNRNVSKDIKS